MHIVRYLDRNGPQVGLLDADSGTITGFAGISTLGELLRLGAAELRERCAHPDGAAVSAETVRLLAPIDGRTELWAAGVTYEQSRSARVEESERSATVYEQIYDAERPELFFKSVAWKVVGDGEPISVRDDSQVDVPEPELAIVANAAGEIVGYTVCDDVSSRTIEGENPLYLPQAKVFLGAAALGPGIRPAWEIDDPYQLEIALEIIRGGGTVWSGKANTSQLHRRLDDLVGYLRHADMFPDGVILSTGTCLVPEMPFTLSHGDTVEITIEKVGRLRTPVVQGLSAAADALAARDDRVSNSDVQDGAKS
ncbi:MAG TPA: fumarylacetoacetate hydrolase family protein [Mycobacteriales bacterium]|nr:fumarylacetoacetate hydrolase family protein [Mycobacteriales bacterium]